MHGGAPSVVGPLRHEVSEVHHKAAGHTGNVNPRAVMVLNLKSSGRVVLLQNGQAAVISVSACPQLPRSGFALRRQGPQVRILFGRANLFKWLRGTRCSTNCRGAPPGAQAVPKSDSSEKSPWLRTLYSEPRDRLVAQCFQDYGCSKSLATSSINAAVRAFGFPPPG